MEATVSSNKYRTLLSDIMIFIIGTVLAKAIQFILMPLYTTYMSTEAYGIAELTNNLSELFFPIATLCVYEAEFRVAVGPEFSNRKLATAVAKVMLISSGIGLFIAIFVKIFLGYQYAFYLFFILYAYSIRMCAAYYIRGNGKSKIFAMSGVVNAISLSIFNVIFLVILKTGENGYLFKPSNVEDLIKKIKMLDDDTLVKKMGQASRKRLESRFAPQTHYEDLMKIFNEAVKSRK